MKKPIIILVSDPDVVAELDRIGALPRFRRAQKAARKHARRHKHGTWSWGIVEARREGAEIVGYVAQGWGGFPEAKDNGFTLYRISDLARNRHIYESLENQLKSELGERGVTITTHSN